MYMYMYIHLSLYIHIHIYIYIHIYTCIYTTCLTHAFFKSGEQCSEFD